MVFQCPRCGKNDFKKTRDLTNHLNRKFKCKQTQIPNPVQPPSPNIPRPQLLVPSPPSPVVRVRKNHLSLEDLANWLANPEIKNNPNVISKKVSKTDAEWFDLMEKSPSRSQKKPQVSQLEEDSEARPGPATQAYRKEILTPKPPLIIRNAGPVIGYFQGYEFISNEDAKRWDQEQHEPREIRLPTLAELKDQLGIKKKAYKEKLTFTLQDKVQEGEDDPNDLDKKVPWPVPFPDKECHREVWQKEIQIAKDMFKVDGAEYTFLTWFTEVPGEEFINILLSARSEKEVTKKVKEVYLQRGLRSEEKISEYIKVLIEKYKAKDKGSPEWKENIETDFEGMELYEAGMTKERAKEILNVIDDDRFLIRVKFVRDNSSYGERHNYAFKIIDKYQPIRESKRAGKKFVPGGPNVILTKKTKPGFWVGIDEKFLVRIIQGEKISEYRELDANAVVYGLY
jgi:hypothetical protein